MRDLLTACEIFTETWPTPDGNPPTPTNLLRALSYSGSYVAGAFLHGQMIGGSVAFLAKSGPLDSLFSHSLAVLSENRSLGVGHAIKLHQRMWALRREIDLIAWTYDPLVSKNAYFNLNKLGARGVAYLSNFYGEMHDKLNAGGQSDRVLIEWRLKQSLERPTISPERQDLSEASLLLTDVSGVPQLGDLALLGRAEAFRLQIPFAIEARTSLDTSRLRAWNSAMGKVMKAALAADYVLTSYTPDLGYLLVRGHDA